ncbi:aaa family ATPase, partial [Apodospora peruviana]
MVLSARKTIPEVRQCIFADFKNRFDPKGRDGHFAMDVLVSGNLLHQEIQAEHQLRDKLFQKRAPQLMTRIVSNKSLVKAVRMANLNMDLIANAQSDEDKKWPRRIRLQSPHLIQFLARANREPWTNRPRTYYRPFNALIYHHPQMKQFLKVLEEKYGDELDAMNALDARDESSSSAADDEDDSSESANPTEEDDEEDDEEDPDKLVDSPKALACLRAYVDYMDRKIMPDYHKYENMDVDSNATVRFSDLWYLFRTGELVYRQVDGELPDRRDFRTGKRIWKTFYVDPVPERLVAAFTDDDEIRDTATRNDDACFTLGCYYIDHTGEDFSPVKTEVKIEQFSGEMPVTSLAVYPMRFCRDHKGRLKHANETGDKLIKFMKDRHCSYNGWTLTRDPSGDATTDWEGKPLEQPEHVNSEVMVDFGEAFQRCPLWRPQRASMRHKVVDGLTVSEDFKIRWWSGADRAILMGETTEQIPVRSGVTWKQRNAYVSNDPFLQKVNENARLLVKTTEEHLNLGENTKALLTGRVFAYVFQERKFAQLAVAKLRPSPKTGLPLHSLKIPQTIKNAIQGSIHGHFLQKYAERKIDQAWSNLDLIEGKGTGLFILLHGVPGVGKTATAEAIAKANGKPLFKITVGDLGMTPENLETSLREIFRLASIWDCILLLDEVDTFFSARSKQDTATTKNGLVSEFLRVLDYYDGILFLTTNRAGVLDEAFKSRIHYKIYYPNLSLEQTLDIWNLNIERVTKIEEQLAKAEHRDPLQIKKDDLLAFAKRRFVEGERSGKRGHWNGRQIRNAFQVARSLAYYEHALHQEKLAERRSRQSVTTTPPNGGPADLRDGGVMLPAAPTLEVRHFETMHEITASFEKYCIAVRGGLTDAEFALENEYRYDGYQDLLT